jgi:photosystem II stability/assembly factor-like uncharacterized protein
MSGTSGGYPFIVTTGDILRFVDRNYSISGGDSGNVLLDINASPYCIDEWEFPPPKPRIEWIDPSHSDGRDVSYSKWENREITIHMHVYGLTVDDLSTNIRALWAECLADKPILEWQPNDWDEPLFADLISPPLEIDPPDWFEHWIRDYPSLNVLANLTLVFEAKPFLRGAKEYLTLLENIAPNASFENWSGGDTTIDDWTITVAGASTITHETGTILDGRHSVKMVMAGGAACHFETTGYITVDITEPYYLDTYIYSTAANSITIRASCYESDGTPISDIDFWGTARGGTAWDRENIYLYQSGAIANYYIPAASWPALTAKVKLSIYLLNNGTIYVDKLWFGSVEYVSDYCADGVIGLNIDGIKGDVPALADFYLGNPYTSPPWKEQESGITDDLYGVNALDATHVWAVGDASKILFYDGVSWDEQTSGVAADLYGVSAFDTTHAWAVGEYGTIRFYGAPWTPQVYPETTPTFTDMALDVWTNPTTLTNWTKTEVAGTLNEYAGGGIHGASFLGSALGLDIKIESTLKSAVDSGNTYLLGIWGNSTNYPWRGDCVLQLYASFFDAGGVYLGSKSQEFYPTDSWVQRSFYITPADYPWGTTQMTIGARGHGTPTAAFKIMVDSFGIMLIDVPDLYGVHAISATNIVAVGQCGDIIESENGTTWSQRLSGTGQHLHSVHHEAGTPRWYAVGDNGTILTSPDANTWTIRVSGTTKDLYGVYALDATHIWAVGEDGTILFSANAGVTWTPQSVPISAELRSVYAFNTTNVWASGDDGTIFFFNGTTWTLQSSGTGETLYGIDGLSATSIWSVGGTGTILYGVYSAGALAITDLILGERNGYSDIYNPVKETPALDTLGGAVTIAYSPYRRWSSYRTLAAGKIVDFLFSLTAHYGSRYMITAGISFGAATAFDKGTIHLLLQTTAGTAITTQYISDEVDLGDPNTKFREVALQTDDWDVRNVPSHVVSDDAVLGNINQVVELIAHASLATTLYIDYIAIIPVDHWTRVKAIVSNYLIIDSTLGYVMDSLDGGPSTAMAHAPTNVVGVPDFVADPEGMNLTLVAIQDVANDQRVGMVNIEMQYTPLYLLVSEG